MNVTYTMHCFESILPVALPKADGSLGPLSTQPVGVSCGPHDINTVLPTARITVRLYLRHLQAACV